jgi:hypothetical protein
LAQGDVGSPIDREAFAAFNLPLDDVPADTPLEIWPENAPTVIVFSAMSTQWSKSGFSGRLEGLRYDALPVVMRYCGIPPSERSAVFFGVRLMERATMEVINGQY